MTDFHDIKSLIEDSDEKVHAKLKQYDQRLTQIQDDIVDVRQKGVTVGFASNSPKFGLKAIAGEAGIKAVSSGTSRSSGPIDLGLSVKALTSLQGSVTSPQAGIDVQSQREAGLFGYAMRPLTLLEALPSRPIASNSLTFTRMSSFTNAADTQEGESVTKAEQTIDPTLVTAAVETLAVWHDASRQVLDDEAGLMLTIGQLLQHGVQAKAESQIISGTGTGYSMSGLLTEGTTFVPSVAPKADRIGESAATMQAAGYVPDLVILHPADWFQIRSERAISGDEQYVGPGWASVANQTVYGMPVVVSPAVSAGTAIVVDRRMVSVLDRMSATIEVSTESGSNFKSNIATILAELRLGIAVFDKKAVNVIDLDTSV